MDERLLRSYVAAAAEGDDVAVAAFVRATESYVRSLCAALGSGADEVDDLAQEVYVRAFTGLSSFRGEASVRTWLARIGRNTCADAVRRQQRRRRITRAIVDEPTAQPAPDHARAVSLNGLLATLDRDRRDAFVLTQVVGMSYTEAADVLDCAVGTIRSRVARARADLATATHAALIA